MVDRKTATRATGRVMNAGFTGYRIDYKNLSEANARFEALKDARDYCGENLDIVIDAINQCESMESAIMCLGFAGLQGYPAKVFVEFYAPHLYGK